MILEKDQGFLRHDKNDLIASDKLFFNEDTNTIQTSQTIVNDIDIVNKDYVDTHGGGGAIWGSITGTLSDQTDLNLALAGKLSTSGKAADSTLFDGKTLPALENGKYMTNNGSSLSWATVTGSSFDVNTIACVNGCVAILNGNVLTLT